MQVPTTMTTKALHVRARPLRWLALLAAIHALAAVGCATHSSGRPGVGAIATAAPLASSGGGAVLQERRQWRFAQDGVVFDNRLDAARLNQVERVGAGHYRLHIAPEIQPVNPSPWYGFKVSSATSQTLQLHFHYADGYRHRYSPKLSIDGVAWREAMPDEFSSGPEGDASLALAVDAQPVWVFAQPPFGAPDYAQWVNRLADRVPLRRRVIGESLGGRPLHLLEFGGGPDSPLLLVLGRQHPPETTGSQALLGFVDALAADSPSARAFRQRVRVLVVHLLNPDGVAEGHWRGNLAGADLNRDWGPFAQPETRALRDALQAEVDAGRQVAFAIDFHSTFRDVFYTVAEDPSRAPGGLLKAWMDAMQARFPGRIEEKAFAATTSVFKNWAYCRFGAPAVTYEVGDTTPPDELGRVSAHAAQALMALWPDRKATPPPTPDCVRPAATAAG